MTLPKPGEVWERDGERREVVALQEPFVHYLDSDGQERCARDDEWDLWTNPPPAPPPARLVRTADGREPRGTPFGLPMCWDMPVPTDEQLERARRGSAGIRWDKLTPDDD